MSIKLIFIAHIILLLANVVYNSKTNDQETFPKLLYLTPKSSKASYTLNERDSLTNEIKKGWIIKSEEEIELLLYILVDGKITKLEKNYESFIYFTNNESDLCQNITSRQSPQAFKLDFIQDRSKLRFTENDAFVNRRRARKLNDLSSLKNNLNPSIDIETTLLVAETNIKLKHSSRSYFTCLSFSKDPNENLVFFHQGSKNVFSQIITTRDLLPIYLVVIFYFVLLCFSALFSGLNLGLMSLDLTELNILKKIGNEKEKKYASKIHPLRKRGNLLLCTILIGNVLVNSTSTLILGNYLEGIFAAMGSTLLIVIFGEIIPQAICSRHGLAVGAHTRFITYCMVLFTFVVSYPLSRVLDFFLGKEIASTYNRDIVRELMRQAKEDKGIEEKQFKLIAGALDFKHKVVKDIMVPLNDVFSLDINSILDFETFKIILQQGYSRIPVYEGSKEYLVGMILIQDLLLNDPADKVPLKAVIEYYKHRVPKCKLQDSLGSMFDKFRKGDSHLAFVYENDSNLESQDDVVLEAVGIVTFENIIEELVQSDIKDEADTKRERRKQKNRELLKGKLGNVSLSHENLNIFVEADHSNGPLISPQIRKALFYFLASSVRPFTGEFINPKILEAFLRMPHLTIEKRNLSGNDEFIYEYGVECDYFIIILDGKAKVKVGTEGYEVDAGLFSYYGVNALANEEEKDPLECIGNDSSRRPYKPEFSLKVDNYCVCLKITRQDWKDPVKKSLMERNLNIRESKLRENGGKNVKDTKMIRNQVASESNLTNNV
ncbi:unnamed protein product [Brachionus calyciflorus]|uniref:Uncharacterized protein n=1 Tax=Brachionus calyciflorus TaxID=104777 RepID=A0A814L2L6_9BILA|nr:unnamed protein product [Brachionus calyciflorus]